MEAEEAAKKAKGGKGKGKKAEEEAVVEEQVEETEEQKLEREKAEIKEKIEATKQKIEQYNGKVKLAQEEREKVRNEEKRKKVLDVQQKDSAERKFLKEGSREYASTVLGERKAFVFGEIKEDAEGGEEEFVAIKINGAACRTPDEDIKWEEEEA